MFNKKNDNQSSESTITVSTIPEEFYGGKNPVVSFKNVTTEVDIKEKKSVLTENEKKAFQQKTSAGGEGGGWHLVNLVTNPKFLAIFAGIIFIVSVLGVGGYYYIRNTYFAEKIDFIPTPIVETTPEIPSVPIVEDQEPEIIPEPEEPDLPETVVTEIPLEFPSILLAESADLDNDGLTDLAEEEFGTDPSNFDTDGDSYPDGLEIYYLYNPKGFEPQKLVDSNLVKVYENLNFSYRVYLPVNWAVGAVDQEERQVLFSTLSGENIEVRVFDLQSGESFENWFTRMAPSQNLSLLVDFETRFGYSGKMRNDNLVYYFIKDNRVYVLLYHTTDSMIVNYKSVLSLVARSLDFEVEKPNLLEDQEVLVTPPVTENETEESESEADEMVEEINTEEEMVGEEVTSTEQEMI